MASFRKVFLGLITASLAICIASCGGNKPAKSSNKPTSYQPVETIIGEGGGKVTDAGKNVEINIPQNALSEDTTITAQYVDSEVTISNDISNNFLAAIEFGPSGTVFNEPVTVSLKLNETPTNNSLSVFCYDQTNNIWDFVTSATYANGNANFNISHFSKYQVLDITPDMYMKFVDLVLEAQSTGKNDAWIRDSYENYLIDEKHVMDYYQEYDGYYYEPCGLRVFGKYQINGKEGDQDELAIRNGTTNKAGNSYGVSKVGGLTVGRAEANQATSSQETIDVTVTIDYKIINPDFTMSASKTKVKKGESTTINVYCHYAKAGNVIYPDIALPGYPLNVSQPTHFTIDKTIITTNNDGRASFVAKSIDGKEDTLKVVFNDAGAYAEGKIKINADDGYTFSGRVVQEFHVLSYVDPVHLEIGCVTTTYGSADIVFTYDFTGFIKKKDDGKINGEFQITSATAVIESTQANELFYDFGEGYSGTVETNMFYAVENVDYDERSFPFNGSISNDGTCITTTQPYSDGYSIIAVRFQERQTFDGGNNPGGAGNYMNFYTKENPFLEFKLEPGTHTNTCSGFKDEIVFDYMLYSPEDTQLSYTANSKQTVTIE